MLCSKVEVTGAAVMSLFCLNYHKDTNGRCVLNKGTQCNVTPNSPKLPQLILTIDILEN